MTDDGWHDVLTGPDTHRWAVRGGCRDVLVAVHSVTGGQRLLDVVDLVGRDPRVRVVYTKVPDISNNGVDGLLWLIGATVIPWEKAIRSNFDLAIAAAHGQLHRLHAPVVLLRRSGDPRELLHNGTVVPSLIAVPHTDELERLRRRWPDVAKAALLSGDPCFDRLLVSGTARAGYRESLHVGTEHTLVVVASGHGPGSLLGRSPGLLDRLAAELPLRRYRVAALIHPAAWFSTGISQIRSWLTDSRAAGLQLVEPFADWRPVLAAADVLLGDHGRLSAYAAAGGVPVVLTDAPRRFPPTSAPGVLSALAPRLDGDRPLAGQIDAARRAFTGAAGKAVAERITSVPGGAAAVLRREAYRLLALAEPGETAGFSPVAAPRRMI